MSPYIDWKGIEKRMEQELNKDSDLNIPSPDEFKGANIDRFMMRYLEHNIQSEYVKCEYCGQFGAPHMPCGFCGAPRKETNED